MNRPLLPLLALAAPALGIALGIALATIPAQSAAPANRELGFVLTEFAPATYQREGDCPEGLSGTIRENYLARLDAAERTRLSLSANEAALTAAWKASTQGPNHTNFCANPEAFPGRAQEKPFQGKVAAGLDLGAPECGGADQGFTSPQGEAGIDNQAYRAIGCSRNYRGVDGVAGDIVGGSNMRLATGEQSIVLRLRGVDSTRDDDSVEVIIASTDDRPVLDSKGRFVTGASFAMHANPAWRNRLAGRIVNGVLTTEPGFIRLDRKWGHGGQTGARAEWLLNAARLRLTFAPDGSLKGVLGAYQTPRNIMISSIAGGLGAATVAGIDCPSQYNALLEYADRARDSVTGQCTQVSMALDVAAVPAFVHEPAANQPVPGS